MLLNCDLGEGFGSWEMGLDTMVMPHIHQANIACGFHASDPLTMDQTVQLAKQYGVSIGAHPAYPDLVGFGRRSMSCTHEQIVTLVTYQIGALQAICKRHGVALDYVKPHGALYNDMMIDDQLLESILVAVQGCGGELSLMLMATTRNKHYQTLAHKYAVSLLFEFFADRAYINQGLLMPRSEDGAVLHNSEEIVSRVKHLISSNQVITANGQSIALEVDTICVHGDNVESVAVAEQLRQLIDAG